MRQCGPQGGLVCMYISADSPSGKRRKHSGQRRGHCPQDHDEAPINRTRMGETHRANATPGRDRCQRKAKAAAWGPQPTALWNHLLRPIPADEARTDSPEDAP